jgi:hypothetical protein
MTVKSIAVLTSGGDSQGMNAGVRAVVRSAIFNGLEVYAIQRGYYGLIHDDIRQTLWKFIAAKTESLHKAVKKSLLEYLGLINSLLPLIIKSCQNYNFMVKHYSNNRRETIFYAIPK